jgi:hypothetical protein
VNDIDGAKCDPTGRQSADNGCGPAASSPDATLPPGDALAHACWVGDDIETSGRIEPLPNEGIRVAHRVLPRVSSTVSAARRVPRALWRAFFTALSPMPSASPAVLID